MTPEIYLALSKQIKSQFPAHYIDLYLEQYDDPQSNPLFADTAWLIEFRPISWELLGNDIQAGQLGFIVHHVSATAFDDSRRMTGVSHWVDDAALFKCLHRFFCNLQFVGINSIDPLINTVKRVESEMLSRLSSLIVTKQHFSAYVYDFSACKQYQEVLASIRVDVLLAQNLLDDGERVQIALQQGT